MLPVRIAKTICGKIVKVYDQNNDWQVIISGAKYPELWFTRHRFRSSIDAANNAIEINCLELFEFIK